MARYHRNAATVLACIAGLLLVEKPAMADTPAFWGLFGSVPTLFMARLTEGLALIVVVIIEAVIFKKMLAFGWGRAFLVSVVVNVASALIGLVFLLGFMNPSGLPALIFFIILLVFCILTKRVGFGVFILALISSAIGMFGISYSSHHGYPIPRYMILPTIWAPLLFGFGITLLIEDWVIWWFSKNPLRGRGIIYANVASYIFLALLMLFLGPNPYQAKDRFTTVLEFADKVAEGMPEEQVMKILDDRHASILALLGLGHGKIPIKRYDSYELFLLQFIYGNHGRENFAPSEVGLEIVNYVSGLHGLPEIEYQRLEWFKNYLTFRARMEKEARAGNWKDVDSILVEWKAWHQGNPWPSEHPTSGEGGFSLEEDAVYAKE